MTSPVCSPVAAGRDVPESSCSKGERDARGTPRLTCLRTGGGTCLVRPGTPRRFIRQSSNRVIAPTGSVQNRAVKPEGIRRNIARHLFSLSAGKAPGDKYRFGRYDARFSIIDNWYWRSLKLSAVTTTTGQWPTSSLKTAVRRRAGDLPSRRSAAQFRQVAPGGERAVRLFD